MQSSLLPSVHRGAPIDFPGVVPDPLYPESDGQPMGESDIHLMALMQLLLVLRKHFRSQPDVYVAGDQFVYFQKGISSACKAPDVLVARHTVGKHPRLNFRVWEEGVIPCAVIEIASIKSFEDDLSTKKEYYESQEIPEYFVCDPEGKFISPVVQGFRLDRRRYRPIPMSRKGRVPSETLGLELFIRDTLVRVADLTSGRTLLTDAEELAKSRRAQRKTRRELGEIEAENERLAREKREAEARAAQFQKQLEELQKRLKESGER